MTRRYIGVSAVFVATDSPDLVRNEALSYECVYIYTRRYIGLEAVFVATDSPDLVRNEALSYECMRP